MVVLGTMDPGVSVHEVTFVALDFETTGLYPERDSIIEFGAVRFKGRELLGTFEALVTPATEYTAEAMAISGISAEMLLGKPAIDAVMPDFVSFLGDAVLVAHNAPFDIGFLRATCQRLTIPALSNRIVDTQTLAQKALPRQKSYSLQNLAAGLGIESGNAHRALDDAETCMRLFWACVDAMSFMGELTLSEVLS
ncbi:MAG: PolC-type DNA polymerase III [Spirochaetota bacterium]